MLKYQEYLTEEVGLRNIKKIISGHTEFEIFFHKDLDGISSALAMKSFLQNYYGLKLFDSHIIQYGGLEFAIKYGKPGTLKVLVDFAHSRPMFKIATDHHDKQVGGEDTESTYFKPARSNVEIISGEISYSDIFTPGDVELIKTIDSANFLKYDIKPEDIQNSLFKFDKEMGGEKGRFMMGFVVNRLLLAYKNKRITVKSLDGKRDHINKNILECMVLDCSPSLYSMYNNIKHYINTARVSDRAGVLAKPEVLMQNLTDYIERMKNYRFIEDPETGDVSEYDPTSKRHQTSVTARGAKIGKGVHFDEKYKIIIQYGGGSMIQPGSYDRYVPFKNYPEANFICMVWPLGLIQVSCNPFKEKLFKDINLGEIAKEVISRHQPVLSKILITLDSLKKEFETSQDWKKMLKDEGPGYEGVGFKFSDLSAFYKDCIYKVESGSVNLTNDIDSLKTEMDTVYSNLTDAQLSKLRGYLIPVWELITRNSGGHPSITNLQGWNFLKYNTEAMKIAYGVDKYVDVMKKVSREFVDNLKDKIDKMETGQQIQYAGTDVELKGHDTNESFTYHLLDSKGKTQQVSKEEFVKAGSVKSMKPENGIKIDHQDKKIIAKFENFRNFK
jgi:hypothetical protein